MEMFLLLLFVPLLFLLLLGWLTVEFCPLLMLFLQLNLCCGWFKANGGKLHACKDFLMCLNSLWSDCAKVLKTLCLATMKCLLSPMKILIYVCGVSVNYSSESAVGTW